MGPSGRLLLVLIVLCALLGTWLWAQHDRPRSRRSGSDCPTKRRVFRPRTPDDCPACRAADRQPPRPCDPLATDVRPWTEVKSQRGAPKRLSTQGYACPSLRCDYYGISDERVHALVGDGRHGATERIQDFRCQACGTKVTSRWGTPLYRTRTPAGRIAEVLSALAEGRDVGAAVRVFGHSEATITRWLDHAGQHATRVHQRFFRELHLPHVQLDEIRTRLRQRSEVLWLWLTLDPLTKIIPALHLGARSQEAAHTVVHNLQATLAPDCVPLVTTDGLRLYFYALTAHFGSWMQSGGRRKWRIAPTLLYGQIQKVYRRRRVVRVTQRVLCGTWERCRTALQTLGLSGRLNTAFIERLNLTVRHGVAALTRRTWATAQHRPTLLGHLEWWRGYYHFVRPHRALRVRLPQPRERGGQRVPQRYRTRTPAMAAGLTTHRWTAVEFLAVPCPRPA